MNTQKMDKNWRELASGYALGSLEPSERIAFEAQLAVDPALRAEVNALCEVVGEIGLTATPVTPSPQLWQKIRGGLGFSSAHDALALGTTKEGVVQPWKEWPAPAEAKGLLYVAAGSGEWEETAIAGVRVRKLFVDEANDRATMLVQMDAGTSYPGHRHAGAEECYVLAGDLIVGDRELVMKAGDYQRADSGSHHPVQWTENGCLLFIVSSLHDELDALSGH